MICFSRVYRYKACLVWVSYQCVWLDVTEVVYMSSITFIIFNNDFYVDADC